MLKCLVGIRNLFFFSVQCINPWTSNGRVHADKPLTSDGMYPYNTHVRWTCVAGYRREGHETAKCLADGKWSQKTPHCWYSKELTSFILHYVGHFTAFMSVMDHFLTLNRTLKFLNSSWGGHVLGVPP